MERAKAALLLGALGVMSGLAGAADSAHDGPWFNARVGTMISYRAKQAMPTPGAPDKVAIISEEVVGVTPDTVTVKLTRKEAGQPDKTSTANRARRISDKQYAEMLNSLGYERKSIEFKVSGQSFNCREYKREIDSPDGDPDRAVITWTTFCRDLPGWIASQSVGSLRRFEMLDVKR